MADSCKYMQRRWQINVPVRFQVPKLREAPRRVLRSSSAFRALALAKPALKAGRLFRLLGLF
jgi:hypothetical protein